jgi:tetratricopeptide (TPR) repeat protein
LTELAMCWAELRLHLDVRQTLAMRRQEGVALLEEAAARCGRTQALDWLRGYLQGAAPTMSDELSARDAYLVGRVCLQMGEVAKAAPHLERSLSLNDADYWSNYCHGICCTRLGRHREAIRCFSVCVGQAPTHSECFFLRGKAHAALEQWPLAERDFEKSLTIRPNVGAVLYSLARAQATIGKKDVAGTTLTRLLRIEPNHQDGGRLLQQLSVED